MTPTWSSRVKIEARAGRVAQEAIVRGGSAACGVAVTHDWRVVEVVWEAGVARAAAVARDALASRYPTAAVMRFEEVRGVPSSPTRL